MFAPNPYAYWDDESEAQFRAAMDSGVQQFALPGELAKTNVGEMPPPPPPPPPPQRLAAPGVPVADEVPQAAVTENPLIPEEFREQAPFDVNDPNAHIAADGSTPFGDAGIEIDQPQQGQPLAVDAISGSNDPGFIQNDDVRSPVDPYTGINSPDVGEASDAWTQLAQTNPDEYLKQQQHAQDIENDKRRAEEARVIREDADREVRNNEAHMQAMERAQHAAQQLDADVQELSKQQINPDRWLHSRNSWQTVTSFIAVIAGGLAQSAGAGRNVGLDIINKSIDDDIAAQVQNIQNQRGIAQDRRGLVADMYARTGDIFRAQETARIAMREQAVRAIEVEMAQYDPRGTAARKLAEARLQAIAAAQKGRQEFAKASLDFETKQADLRLKQLDIQAKKAKLAGSGTGTQKFTPDYFSAQGLPPPPFPMSEKEYNTFLSRLKSTKDLAKDDSKAGKTEAELRKQEADAQKAEAEAEASKTGFVIASPETGEAFINKDGKAFVVMDADERKRLRGITTAAANIRRLADKVEEVRKKTGGGSKLMGSDDAQELESLAKAVDFETYKAFDLGAPSAGDTAMAEGIRGGVDLTSFLKDPKKGLQAYADTVEKKALSHLRGAGYTGETLRFRRASDLSAAKKDVVDEIGGKLTSSFLKAAKQTDNPLAATQQQIAGGIFEPLNKETEASFEQLLAYAEQQNDMGDRARNYLREISEKAVYPEIKAKAKAALANLPGANARKDGAR